MVARCSETLNLYEILCLFQDIKELSVLGAQERVA